MWVRGLKPTTCLDSSVFFPSHPMWVRGLKHTKNSIFQCLQ